MGWQPETQPKGKPPVEKTKGSKQKKIRRLKMINLDLRATYDGYDVTATFEIVKELRQLGMTDEEINIILERSKDKERSGNNAETD